MAHPVAPDWDRAGPEQRRAWIAHVDRCEPCRDAWLREDPSRLFAALGDDPVPRSVLDEVTLGVMRAVTPAPARAGWTVAAAWAAAFALAAALVPWGASRDRFRETVAMAQPAEVQVLDASESTRIVDVTLGGIQVVMIFDEELEL